MGFERTRPDIDSMSESEMARFLAELRRCTKCEETKATSEFSITTERGRKVVRSRCKVCMAKYYQTVADRKKHGPPKQDQLSKRDRDNKRNAVKKNAKVTLSVVKDFVAHSSGHGGTEIWRVLRSLNGCKPRQVGFFINEQSADAEAKRLNEYFNERTN